MKGRELIIYILTNNLEDEDILAVRGSGKLIGFIDENEAAVRFNVGTATIRVWAHLEMIDHIELDGNIYIPESGFSRYRIRDWKPLMPSGKNIR